MTRTIGGKSKRATAANQESNLNAIDLIKKDHRMVNELFEHFENSSNKRERMKILNDIVRELSIHASIEEKHIYPLLKKQSREMAEKAIEEHHVVKLMLAELADLEGIEETTRAKVLVLCEIVQEHVNEEEKDLLPKLRKADVDLDELGEQLLQEKEKLMANMKKVGDKSKRQIGGSPAKRRKAS